MTRKDKSSKRKSREKESATANGVGSEAIHSKVIGDKDGVVVMDDLSEPTMGEKLASLKLAEDGEATNQDFVDIISRTKPPTVDSVYILLKQALRADDQALLIDCLKRQDEKVISNSLLPLNPSDVITLVRSLLSIVGLRGAAVLACGSSMAPKFTASACCQYNFPGIFSGSIKLVISDYRIPNLSI
ncbi:uncharacterized protein [Primulina eburnea]|uniref:uncharacterized protein n=1 Tax=Primulina eburnea TaxID=1245227 RepID=UPI003C6C14B4